MNENWDKIDEAYGDLENNKTQIETMQQDITDIKEEQDIQDSNIEMNRTSIQELEAELADTQTKLDRTRASLPKVSGEGEYVTLDGTSEDEFIEPPLPMGKTEQVSYTGSNLLVTTLKDEITKDGITLTPLGDGRYKINGTASGLVDFWIQSYNYSTTEETLEADTTYYAKAFFEGTHSRGVFLNLWNGSSYDIETNETQAYNGYAFTPTANITQKGFKIMFPSGGSYTDCIVGAVIAKSNVDTYEPYVGGTASPNPDYPQEIRNVSGDVNVTVENKNLIPFTNQDFTVNNVHYCIENGSLILNGTSTSETSSKNSNFKNNFDFNLPAGTYTISHKTGVIAVYLYNYDDDTNKILTLAKDTRNTSFTLEKETHLYIGFYVYQNTFNNANTEIMIENSSTATSYVPHQQQTFTFPLSQGQKLMEGDYLADDGIHHVRGQVVLDGSENWGTSSNEWNRYYLRKDNIKKQGNILSSHFIRYIGLTDANREMYGKIDTGYWGTNYIFIQDYTAFDTLEEFKTWLSENNVTVEYELAEEVIEPYTSAQETAYNNIKKALSYKDQTNIYSTNEVSPKFKVTAYKDVSIELENIKQAIVALGGVV